jgi:hypothetical protein
MLRHTPFVLDFTHAFLIGAVFLKNDRPRWKNMRGLSLVEF